MFGDCVGGTGRSMYCVLDTVVIYKDCCLLLTFVYELTHVRLRYDTVYPLSHPSSPAPSPHPFSSAPSPHPSSTAPSPHPSSPVPSPPLPFLSCSLTLLALMKLASLVTVGQATNVVRARRMTVTTPPPLHSQVSTVTLCVCVFVCVNGHVMWAVSGAAIINIPLSAHCMPCSCHMSSVQSRSRTMSSHTPCECYVCGPLSACISCAFSVYPCSRPLV